PTKGEGACPVLAGVAWGRCFEGRRNRMNEAVLPPMRRNRMNEAVLPPMSAAAIADWAATEPRPTGDYEHDVGTYYTFWRGAESLMRQLPAKPQRSPDEAAA